MNDILFLSFIVVIISFIIYLIVQHNKHREKTEENENIIIKENGAKKQICFWCKQEINVGAKICPFCRKVPTETGQNNNQIKIFVTILLIIIAIILWF